MTLPLWFGKKIPPILAFPLLVFFSVCVFSLTFFVFGRRFVEAQLQAVIAPFDGYITYVEYVSCVCSLGIKLTITPITQTSRTNWGNSYDLMFYYAPQILESLGINLFDFIPRVYAFYQIWYPGNQKLLGTAIRGSFPCVQYDGTSCSVNSYADGAIFMVGTSLY